MITAAELKLDSAKVATTEKNQRHVLIGTWLGELFDGMDASMFALVLVPAVSELLHTKSPQIIGPTAALILATFMIGWALGAVIFGYLADRIGRTKVMLITILIYAGSSGLCALSASWQELAFYRFITGLGIGGEITIGAVLVSECWKGKDRLHASSFLTSSFGAGYLLAAVFSYFLSSISWRLLFWVGVLPALVTLYIRSKISEPESFRLHKQRQAHTKEADTPLATCFSRENRGSITNIAALASTTIVGYWAILSWIPAWISQITGTAAQAEKSVTVIAMNLGAIAFSLTAGHLVSKVGRRKSFQIAFLLSFLSIATLFGLFKSYSPLVPVMAFFVGGFSCAPFALLFIYVPEVFPIKARTTAFGISVQTGRICAAVASLMAGQIIAACAGSYAAAGSVLNVVYLFGLLATCFMEEGNGEVQEVKVIPVQLSFVRAGSPEHPPAA